MLSGCKTLKIGVHTPTMNKKDTHGLCFFSFKICRSISVGLFCSFESNVLYLLYTYIYHHWCPVVVVVVKAHP